MAITTPCYCTREDVKAAPDMKSTDYSNVQIDRAIQSSSRNIEGHLHRRFYPEDKTKYFDWPAFGGAGGGYTAYPWRLWLDQNDLVPATGVESPPGRALSGYFLEPVNSGPPFTYIELNRSQTSAFSAGATPQHSIKITGTWGYSADTDPAGTLAASVSSTSATTITVSDSSQIGVGDLLIIDTERMLISERAASTTGQTVQGSGINTASAADNVLAVTSGAAITVGEVLLVDAEKMLAVDVTGNNVTVKRAWDGSALATHTAGTTVNAYRLLTVARGQLGTTAATHSNSAPVSRHRVPALIRDLAIAETVNRILQETSGYREDEGGGQAAIGGIGAGLSDLWDEAETSYGRKNRFRVI